MSKKTITTAAFQVVFQIMIFFFLYQNITEKGKTAAILFFIMSLINLITTNLIMIRRLKK